MGWCWSFTPIRKTIAQRTPSFHSLFRIEGHRRERRGGRCDVDIGATGVLGTKLHTSLLQVCETSLGDIGLEGHETHTLGHNLQSFRVTQRGILRCT
jgi:hypothetical protein